MTVDEVKAAARGAWPHILMNLAPGLSEAVNRGTRHGPCPFCGGTDRFRMMDDYIESGAAICNQCGPQDRAGVFTDGFALLEHATGRLFKELLHEVADMVGAGQNTPPRSTPQEDFGSADDDRRARTRRRLNQLFRQATNDDGTISTYLRHRGLSGGVPAALMLHSSLTYYDDGEPVGKYPAIIAAITAPDGSAAGLHMTYLAPGGAGKADLDPARKMRTIERGATRGAAIRVHDAGDLLAVAEGIETALAVREATGAPVWATISAGGMERLQIPDHVRQVEIWADNDGDDGAGQRAAERLAQRLDVGDKTVRIMLPSEAGTDWLDVLNQRGPEALRAARETAETWEPDAGTQDVHLTDLGNARRLVARHGRNIRYSHPESRWYVWNGRVWEPDDTAAIFRLAKATVGTIYGEAAGIADDDERKAIAKHAFRSENHSRLQAMISLAASEPGVPILREQFDRDPWLLTVANGTLDLRTGTLREHRREDFMTKHVPIRYDEKATAPRWERFLLEIVDGRIALTEFLRRMVGYCLTGLTTEQVMFILWGTGSNGKSVFLDILRELLAPLAVATEPDLLMSRRNDAHPTGIAALWGARVAIAVETGEGRRLNETLVKWLTGGDKLTARFMRQDFFEFAPTHKLLLATNHRPVVRGTDHAMWRRIRMVPFTVTFYEPETGQQPVKDPHLVDKLRAELPGILAWAVQGCLEWQRDGLRPPAEVLAATDEYRADMDVVAQFLEDACLLAPNAHSGATDLYNAYKNWCTANGERWLSQRRFGGRLSERGYESRRGAGGTMVYDGIGIVQDFSEFKAS